MIIWVFDSFDFRWLGSCPWTDLVSQPILLRFFVSFGVSQSTSTTRTMPSIPFQIYLASSASFYSNLVNFLFWCDYDQEPTAVAFAYEDHYILKCSFWNLWLLVLDLVLRGMVQQGHLKPPHMIKILHCEQCFWFSRNFLGPVCIGTLYFIHNPLQGIILSSHVACMKIVYFLAWFLVADHNMGICHLSILNKFRN